MRATQVADGWAVCGLCTSYGETFTLLLRRLETTPEQTTGDRDDDGDTTLITGEPLRTVPEALRYRDDSGDVFDVDELVESVAQSGVFKNLYINQALTETGIQRLLNHASGARLRSMEALQAVTPHTQARLLELVELLETEETDGPLVGSTQAIGGFIAFAARLPSQEQAALHSGRITLTDTGGQPFTLAVMQALSGLQRGAGCSRATAKYSKQMVESGAAAQVRVPPAASRMAGWFNSRPG